MFSLFFVLSLQIPISAMESDSSQQKLPKSEILVPIESSKKLIADLANPPIKIESTSSQHDYLIIEANAKKANIFKDGKKIDAIEAPKKTQFRGGAMHKNKILLSALARYKAPKELSSSAPYVASQDPLLSVTMMYEIDNDKEQSLPTYYTGTIPSWEQGFFLDDGSFCIFPAFTMSIEDYNEKEAFFYAGGKYPTHPNIKFNFKKFFQHNDTILLDETYKHSKCLKQSIKFSLKKIKSLSEFIDNIYKKLSDAESKTPSIAPTLNAPAPPKIVGIFDTFIVSTQEKYDDTKIIIYNEENGESNKSFFNKQFEQIYVENEKLILQNHGHTCVINIPKNEILFSVAGGRNFHNLKFEDENICHLTPLTIFAQILPSQIYRIDSRDIPASKSFLLGDWFNYNQKFIPDAPETWEWLKSNQNFYE